MALTDIREINQQELEALLNFNIKHGFNLMVFGPTGSGKSEITMQACKKQNAYMTWCNLSVNERPDIQGYPKMNPDAVVTEFTLPEYIPLPETLYIKEKKALQTAVDAIKNVTEFSDVAKQITARLNEIGTFETSTALKRVLPFVQKIDKFNNEQFVDYVTKLDKLAQDNSQKVVVVFDEADKAPHEVMAPLLELLQFHTLNGRKTAIHSCIVTCNLPDENAHTEKLSHAITNRCFIYKMNIDFDAWRKWAVGNKVHPLIVGFLASNKDMIYKRTNNDDDTAYSKPSPRAWTWASNALYKIENDPEFSKMGNDAVVDLMTCIIAGKVGNTAALKFEVWLKHYRELDPVIEAIAEEGKRPKWNDLNLEQKFVCAIGVCSRLNPELKPKNEARIKKLVKNIFEWIGGIDIDVQTAGVRNALDLDLCKQYGIADLPEATKVFKNIKDKTSND